MRKKWQKKEAPPLQQVSEAFGRFVYGQYVVRETAVSNEEIAFDCDDEELLRVRVHEDRYDMIIDGEVISAANMGEWEIVKQRILAKKEPNRVPFPKETAVYSKCGMRCDLCVYYTGVSDEFREELKQIHRSFWDAEDFGDDMKLCPGCHNKDTSKCDKLKHARKQGLSSCLECKNFPCSDCGHINIQIHPREAGSVVPADVITWALLPYVGGLN
ncbi:MAG: DUF3795 domain-containing protein [Oscillospiraceae bacterium]|nr:DUF3795 domain-containing protein [Oscillospiraceae bacterium]